MSELVAALKETADEFFTDTANAAGSTLGMFPGAFGGYAVLIKMRSEHTRIAAELAVAQKHHNVTAAKTLQAKDPGDLSAGTMVGVEAGAVLAGIVLGVFAARGLRQAARKLRPNQSPAAA